MSMHTDPHDPTGQVAPSRRTDAGPISSRVLLDISNQLQSARHPLVTGAVGDLVLMQGQAMALSDAVLHMARRAFDVVVRVNAADDLCVVHGDDAYGRALAAHSTAEAGEAPPSDTDVFHGDEPLPPQPGGGERRARVGRPTARGRRDGDPMATVRALMEQSEVSVLALVEQADIVLQDPAHHDQPDRERVAALQLALRGAARVGRYRNTCVLLAGQASAIPAVLLAGCDDLMPIEAPAPSHDERMAYLVGHLGSMAGADGLDDAGRSRVAEQVARVTEGERLSTLEALVAFSGNTGHSVLTPRELVMIHRHGVRPNPWAHLAVRLVEVHQVLKSRVYGQEPAISSVMAALARAALGLRLDGGAGSSGGAPRAVLWFVGPTGVGKTELAKAIALAVFGDADAYIRIDMSGMGEQQDAARFLGAPPGYVGYEEGGQLTEAVRQHPFSVVLLDEIEKAHPAALDRLMSAIDDGRVTDAQGRVTYFDETVFIFTTNLGAAELAEQVEERGDVTFDEVEGIATRAVREWFAQIRRPEIFGRIGHDGIIAFDVLRPEVVDQVTAKLLAAATLTNGPALDFDAASTAAMVRSRMQQPERRAFGARQVRNILAHELGRLTLWLAQNGHADADRARVSFVDDRMFVAVDGGPATPVD